MAGQKSWTGTGLEFSQDFAVVYVSESKRRPKADMRERVLTSFSGGYPDPEAERH